MELLDLLLRPLYHNARSIPTPLKILITSESVIKSSSDRVSKCLRMPTLAASGQVLEVIES
ncbi:hypothetical protein E2C01_101045 [Portunus trituberculatus]|uniref:Uncharacterized protein n=1 Tax=Portunus trituberculatus TaxID=210409 RepID=A0A5B7KDQ8_PORTR|nr:hypothetical protein [Portunus trituberculatus]